MYGLDHQHDMQPYEQLDCLLTFNIIIHSYYWVNINFTQSESRQKRAAGIEVIYFYACRGIEWPGYWAPTGGVIWGEKIVLIFK